MEWNQWQKLEIIPEKGKSLINVGAQPRQNVSQPSDWQERLIARPISKTSFKMIYRLLSEEKRNSHRIFKK